MLANGAKLAGILLESAMISGDRAAIAVGIGVNVVAIPRMCPIRRRRLPRSARRCDAETLFVALSDAWTQSLRLWDEGRGIDLIRRRWL